MSTPIAASLFAVAMTVSAASAMIIDASTIQIITVAALSAVAPTILALATLKQSKTNTRIARINDEKTDEVLKKTDEIHAVTNSAKAAVDAKLDSANERIMNLEKLLSTLVNGSAQKGKNKPK